MLRTITKLHLSANKTVTPEQAAVNKAHGYLSTDAMTPIIGTWAWKVINTYPHLSPKSLLSEERWKLEKGAWPQKDRHIVAESAARDLNVTTLELYEMVGRIERAENMFALPTVINNTIEIKIPAILGDVVVEPEPVVQCQPQQNPTRNKSKKKRKPKNKRLNAVNGQSRASSTDLPKVEGDPEVQQDTTVFIGEIHATAEGTHVPAATLVIATDEQPLLLQPSNDCSTTDIASTDRSNTQHSKTATNTKSNDSSGGSTSRRRRNRRKKKNPTTRSSSPVQSGQTARNDQPVIEGL